MGLLKRLFGLTKGKRGSDESGGAAAPVDSEAIAGDVDTSAVRPDETESPAASPVLPEVPAPAVSAPDPPRESPGPVDYTVWVGLDFGTATTEAVIQVEDRRSDSSEILVMAWAGESREEAVLVLPSQIRRDLAGGRAGAGTLIAEESLEGVTIEMKTRLLDAAPELAPDGIGDSARCQENADFCDALVHVSMCLSAVKRAIRAYLGPASFRVHVQMAAPIEPARESDTDETAVESRPVEAVFRELGFRALQASDLIDGWELDAAQYEGVLERAFRGPVPAREQSPVTLIPEALAAVAAYLEDPDLECHRFATVDVGGSTTDVTFVWFQTAESQSEGEATCWYYSMRTFRVGTNELVAAVAESAGTEEGGPGHAGLAKMPTLTTGPARDRCEEIAAHIHRCYREAWKNAFEWTGSQMSRWYPRDRPRIAGWSLLLTGGGCDLDVVRESLESPPFAESYFDEHAEFRGLEAPGWLPILALSGQRLERPAARSRRYRDPVSRAGALLTVAYGLSRRTPDLPRGLRDDEGMGRPARSRRDRDWEYVFQSA